jgi:hypothetical protein
MPFFARPDLSNEQFKQLSGSTLTLEGTTDFTGVLKSKGIEIDATSGITTAAGDALVFDGTKIVLTPISGGSSGKYIGKSPAVCNVGGIVVGTSTAILTGKTISCILQDMLVPTLYPTLVAPYMSAFSISPSTTLYEIGCKMSITATTTLNKGSINPVYPPTASSFRSCGAIAHCYLGYGVPTLVPVAVTCLTNSYSIPAHVMGATNIISGRIAYCSGVTAYDDGGAFYASGISSGFTSSASITINAIYPYFWGTSVSAPTAGQALINSGTPVVASSLGDVGIDFNVNTPSKYLWFAIPNPPTCSTPKLSWIGSNSLTNTEPIPGSLFSSPSSVSGINSPSSPSSSCVPWSGVTYSFYISNYATNTYAGGLPYIITFKNS